MGAGGQGGLGRSPVDYIIDDNGVTTILIEAKTTKKPQV